MQSTDPGVLPNSSCFSFTPSEITKKYYYYPVWCGHYFCNSEYFMKRDYYPYLLLVHVRKGEFYFDYMQQQIVARKGDVVLIDCQEPHFYHASDDLEFLYVHFDGVNAHELCRHIIDQHGILFRGEHTLVIDDLLYHLVKKHENNQLITAVENSLAIYQMLAALMSRPQTLPPQDSAVDSAIQYIRNNVGEKITLAQLARMANLSVYYFSHVFKVHTGYSPIEYVISTRLDTAKVLLKTTTLSISEIAYQVGYNNSGSFINMFVQKMGCSPKEFRKAPI